MHLSPAEVAIREFGGVRALARAVNRYPRAVEQWRDGCRRGGNAGDLPPTVIRVILVVSRTRGLPITIDDLVWGRQIDP